MSDYTEYPETNEDGKVLNPDTDNWVTTGYAEGRGFIEEAKEYTQKHFYDQDQTVPETSGSLEDAGENLEDAGIDLEPEFVGDDELDEMLSDVDEEIETGKGEFDEDPSMVSEEEFMKQFDDTDNTNVGPNQKAKGGEYSGVYSSKNPKRNSLGERQKRNAENLRRRDENRKNKQKQPNVKYVRTKRGGIKTVKLDENGNPINKDK